MVLLKSSTIDKIQTNSLVHMVNTSTSGTIGKVPIPSLLSVHTNKRFMGLTIVARRRIVLSLALWIIQ